MYGAFRSDQTLTRFKCVARKVPELCQAYTPGKSEQDVAMRVTRLEQIVERALPRYSSSLRQPPGEEIRESTPETGPGEGDDDDAFGDGRLQGGSWHGVSAIGSVSSGPIIEQVESHICFMRQEANEHDFPSSRV